MLIVWTDHGFMLGEHGAWAKCWLPYFEEIAHTPFFVWDPRCGKRGETRDSLVQPSIDLGPTLLDFFGRERTPDMLGCNLAPVMADDTPGREAAIFGQAGGHVNVTDGRYVYMRAPITKENQPLNEYTLMPTHMRDMFSVEQLRGGPELVDPFSFTKGCRILRIPALPAHFNMYEWGTRLYDLEADPQQQQPVEDTALEERMISHLKTLMRACDAPPEQYQRLGL